MPPTWQVSSWFTDFVGTWPFFDDMMQALGSNYFAPQVMSIILWCLWFGTRDQTQRWHNQKVIIYVTVGALIGAVIAELFVVFQHHVVEFWVRPYDSLDEARYAMETLYFELPDPSFPSNAICGFAAVAANVWFASRRASIVLWGILLLWSLGRIYVGIHYPIDIAGGIVLGFVAAFIARKLVQVFDRQVSCLLMWARRMHVA